MAHCLQSELLSDKIIHVYRATIFLLWFLLLLLWFLLLLLRDYATLLPMNNNVKLLWESTICKLSHVRVRTSARTTVYMVNTEHTKPSLHCVCVWMEPLLHSICWLCAQLSVPSFIHVSNYFELAAYTNAKTLVIVVLYNLSWFSTSPVYDCRTTIDSF